MKIAEFLGFVKITPDKTKPDNFYYQIPDSFRVSEDNLELPKNLLFGADWNWLTWVVEKIESLGFRLETRNHEDNTTRIAIGVHKNYDVKPIVNLCKKDKKEITYLACIEFINWYNYQTK